VIVAQVRRTLLTRRLVGKGDSVVLACSGGPDSVAMVHALCRLAPDLALDLRVASVDHGLRPQARDEVNMVREFSSRLGLPFVGLSVDLSPGPSLQARAREARYAVLLEYAHGIGARRLAVAHTRDDQAETLLSRLLRGSGLDGLSGIAPRRSDGVIRPLIDCARQDVHAHVEHHRLPTVSDPSNRDARFERARLRQRVIPALLEEDPSLITHLGQLADDAQDVRAALSARGRRLLATASLPDGLDATVLSQAYRAERAAALRTWVHRSTGQGPGRAHMEALERLVRTNAAEEVWLAGGYVVTRVGPRLILTSRTTSQNH
jgi:tRNA(Ile)-lysidine synthase